MRRVKVVSYDSAWIQLFQEEAEQIKRIFGDEVIETHHIGSTAIPGIHAKPVLDLMPVVREIHQADRYTSAMEQLGYVAMGENGIEGRRFFQKGGDERTHHVHVFAEGDDEITRHLRFRDFMRAHPLEAERYSRLKQRLAAAYPYDLSGYIEGKDSYIKDIDRQAKEWALSKPEN